MIDTLPQRLIKTSVNPVAATDILLNSYRNGKPSLNQIIETICRYFDTTPDLIKSKSRKKEVIEGRRMYCFFASRHYTLDDAAFFIHSDHATVIHHRRRAFELLEMRSEAELIEKARNVSVALYGKSELPTRSDFEFMRVYDEKGGYTVKPRKYIHNH